jgi:tetratricopeptide (TPR) repeat protein
MLRFGIVRVGAAALALALACAAVAAPKPVDVPLAPTAEDVAKLERQRDAHPNRPELRDAVALAYYRTARAALDRSDFPRYEDYLARAVKEWVESLRLDPKSSTPHVYMGIASAYQGRIEDALDDFNNARSLEPGVGVAYTNIAETMIYADRPRSQVETWLSRGERMGAAPAIVELDYCLLQWREGDIEAAQRSFYRALRFDSRVVQQWNEAPVSSPIRSFEDLTHYCCGSPACGPYLANACSSAKQEVTKHEVPAEVARRELLIEMAKRRALGTIYQQHRELDVRVKDPEKVPDETAPAETTGATPPSPAPAPLAKPSPPDAKPTQGASGN